MKIIIKNFNCFKFQIVISIFTNQFLSFNSFGVELKIPSENIVKIFSSPCNNHENELIGSGILFSYHNTSYILTEEHVVYHKNENYCHYFYSEKLGKNKLELIKVDWGYGLALLKVTAHIPFTPKTLEELTQNHTNQGINNKVILVGYPRDSHTKIQYVDGQVISFNSNRRAFSEINELIEVKISNEFGQSGGGLFSSTGNLIGIPSKQTVKFLPGKSSQIDDNMNSVIKPDHLLAIPINIAIEWIMKVINSNEEPFAICQRDTNSQLRNENTLLAYGLRFNEIITPETPSKINLGGDGVGIGGSKKRQIISIEIEKDDIDNIQLLKKQSKKFNKIHEAFINNEKVIIPYFIKIEINSDQINIEKVNFSNFAEFFYLLKQVNLEPILKTNNNNSIISSTLLNKLEINELTSTLNEIKSLASQMISLLNLNRHQEQTVLFLNKIIYILEVINENSEIIKSNAFNTLFEYIINKNNDHWVVLFNLNDNNTNSFENSVNLMSLLRKLQSKI